MVLTREEAYLAAAAGEDVDVSALEPLTRKEAFLARIAEGGGGDLLNENGKLKNDVLPDGYPYEKTTTFESQTYDYTPVEKSSGNPCHSDSYDGDSQTLRLGNDDLQEGQLIRVNYDGVNYDCVVRYAHFNWWIGNPTLTKNSSENGNMDDGIDYIEKSEHYVDSGEPFCYIVHNYYNTRYALFTLDTKPRTVTFTPIEKEIIPMAEKFLPDGLATETYVTEATAALKNDILNGAGGGGGVFVVNVTGVDENNLEADKTFAEILEAISAEKIVNCRFVQPSGVVSYCYLILYMGEVGIVFSNCATFEDELAIEQITIKPDNSVTYIMKGCTVG